MSNEPEDSGDDLQPRLQPDAPSEAAETIGPVVGPRHQAWCSADVPPGATRCPMCNLWQPGNSGAVVHGGRRRLAPAEVASRDELLDKLFAERGGRDNLDVVRQLRIEDYPTAATQLRNVALRLEGVGPLTAAGRRRSLVDVYNLFSARAERLGSDIGAPSGAPTHMQQFPGCETMPLVAMERTRELLSRLVRRETLTDREQGQLDVLRAAMRGEIELADDRVPPTSASALADHDEDR
jgi:hypothetical protein